ncbi:protein tyrosine phosphatase family protein [Thiosocius teredinicola]|uniref:protein tyrosine phosphatase family protein n=1 Tax=Thiosocius teredinicola TaxID=1973002 RepID=UPI000990C442
MLNDIYNFFRVSEQLVTAGQPTEAQLREVAALDFDVVINLALHDDPRYSLPDETGLVSGLGMRYVHIPVPFDAPHASHLEQFYAAMRSAEGQKVFVHCAANMRATAFVGLYLLSRQRMPEEQAFAALRSVWEPNEVWSAFIGAHMEKAHG